MFGRFNINSNTYLWGFLVAVVWAAFSVQLNFKKTNKKTFKTVAKITITVILEGLFCQCFKEKPLKAILILLKSDCYFQKSRVDEFIFNLQYIETGIKLV